MKVYNREKKRWISQEEHERLKKPRDKKVCRGGKPHDFVLVLPTWGVKWDGVSPYDAEAYYKAMEERAEFIEKQNQALAKKGIIVRDRTRTETKYYVCSVCKKQDYEFSK